MTILSKAIYRFNAIPIKLSMAFFTELEQKCSQFICKHRRPQIAKQSWERKMDLEESTFLTSDYTTKLQSLRQYIGKNKQKSKRTMDQWDKIESPKINSYTYRHLIFDKEGKNIQWRKKNSLFLSMGFSRQEYWSGLPFTSPGDLPDPGIAPGSPAL